MKYIIQFEAIFILNSSGTHTSWWWSEGTDARHVDGPIVPKNVRVFPSEEQALKELEFFVRPWYLKDCRGFKVVAVEPRMISVQDGWYCLGR